jgi:ornithine cyclodeaminase/alanine dehydrogenase-like protein (mu-crystallin family)
VTAVTPVLLYLDADEVRAATPSVEERLDLAHRTMVALVADAELPPKLGVHPRPEAAHTAVMPALLRGPDASGAKDLLGMKWVTSFPTNRARSLPAIYGTVLLIDALTGAPRAILDGGPITAERTAAVSGVALREWWPRDIPVPQVTMVGAGVQGLSHVPVLANVARGAALTIASRGMQGAESLAVTARATGAFASVTASTDLAAAVGGADVVLTMIAFGSDRQILPMASLNRAALVVAVDYDMCIPAELARNSSLFLTDDVQQFRATRQGAVLAGYPDPDGSIGEALLGRAMEARPGGPTYINHLGVGLADVVFADAIVKRAEELGLGTRLA